MCPAQHETLISVDGTAFTALVRPKGEYTYTYIVCTYIRLSRYETSERQRSSGRQRVERFKDKKRRMMAAGETRKK